MFKGPQCNLKESIVNFGISDIFYVLQIGNCVLTNETQWAVIDSVQACISQLSTCTGGATISLLFRMETDFTTDGTIVSFAESSSTDIPYLRVVCDYHRTR